MNKEQIAEALRFLSDPQKVITLSMFIVTKDDDGFSVRRSDITEEAETSLRNQFRDFLVNEIRDSDERAYGSILESDGKTIGTFTFDVDEKPDGLDLMTGLLEDEENREEFNFATDNIEDIFGYIFLIGNDEEKIALYKKQYPISVLRRDRTIVFRKSDTRLEEVKGDLIAIDRKIQFLQIGTELLVLDPGVLERIFGFDEAIKSGATANVRDLLGPTEFVHDSAPLLDRLDNLTFARKLRKLNPNSPVLNVEFEKLKEFIKQHPKLKNKIRFNDDETKISLDTHVSMDLFIRLLDDDYLKSDLTDYLYEVDRKDVVSNDDA